MNKEIWKELFALAKDREIEWQQIKGHAGIPGNNRADEIATAAADHYNGRIVIFTSGTLAGQATDITDYELVGGIGQFTLTALTSAPSNDDTGIII